METGPGEVILAVAVLSILLTAPLGAWAIVFTGERTLKVASPEFKPDPVEVEENGVTIPANTAG